MFQNTENFRPSKNDYPSKCYFTYYISLNNLSILLPFKKKNKPKTNKKIPNPPNNKEGILNPG